MKSLLCSVAISAGLVAGTCGAAPAGSKADRKAQYDQAIELLAQDPAAAAAEMRRLADDEYLRAIDKLAYFHVKGLGVQSRQWRSDPALPKRSGPGKREIPHFAWEDPDLKRAAGGRISGAHTRSRTGYTWSRAHPCLGPCDRRISERAPAWMRDGITWFRLHDHGTELPNWRS